jgi:hypothetical protein
MQIRRELTPEQLRLINEMWREYQGTGTWPVARVVHSRIKGRQEAKRLLGEIGGQIVFEVRESSPGNRYALTIIGVLMTEQGLAYAALLAQYLTFLREQFHVQPSRYDFSGKEVAEGLKLSDDQTKTLGTLVSVSGFFGSFGGGQNDWIFRVPDMIEDLPPDGPLDKPLEVILLQRCPASRRVFVEDNLIHLSAPINLDLLQDAEPGALNSPIVTVDALKRRYQVFVSSTYEDLKEERQHVIQALLETKCIPTGMELFPAASVEQWELIKRVIQECDYYMVIVAGRYGTVKEGISFTEKEFDYAFEIGKSIIGFYHRDPMALSGTKLETSDAGREKLLAFTQKVRKRLCRAWNSPAELGSAVKSAILSELETNQKPGWIRAENVPTSDIVEKLKQQIVDLEEKLKEKKVSKKSGGLPDGAESFVIPLTVLYDFTKRKDEDGILRSIANKKIAHEMQMTWDQFIVFLEDRLEYAAGTSQLKRGLETEICGKVSEFMAQHTGESNPVYDCSVDGLYFERMLKTLMAKKLVKMHSRGGFYENLWELYIRA